MTNFGTTFALTILMTLLSHTGYRKDVGTKKFNTDNLHDYNLKHNMTLTTYFFLDGFGHSTLLCQKFLLL